MRKLFSLIAAVLFAGSMMADSYTITFKESGTDTDSNTGLTSTTPADYIATGAEYVTSVAATGKVYNARTGRGLKFGNSSNPGAVTLTLAAPVQATSIVVQARAYNDTEKSLKIQDKEDYQATTTVAEYTYTYAEATEISTITVGTVSKRGYAVSVTVNYGGGVTPPEPETAPTTAPAVPAQDEANVMAVYCNHYANNNANFGISGWAGDYQTLDLDGTTAAYWTDMTWECIIDPVNTDAAHDFSAYENVHVDMWAPAAAKIKFTAEAVAGGDYKDGQVLDLAAGWNSFDIALADWAGNYDFANLKCFVLEQYQTPEGESFEHNPFAIANIYFWNTPAVGETTCAEVYNMAKDDVVDLLNPVTVTFVNGKNVWVKDATASMLIYFPASVSYAAGDVLSGIAGTVDIYKGLYEVKPSADQAAAVVATAGEAPAPEVLTAIDAANDMNKYITLKNVAVSGPFVSNKLTMTVGENTYELYNKFNSNYAFDAEKEYDIVGIVSIYNSLQVLFISAEEVPAAGCDWDNIEFLGDGSVEQTFANQFKICVGDPAPNVVNIQTPGWGAATGIYITFPSAAFGEISLAEDQYTTGGGAQMLMYLSAFTAQETEVSVVCADVEYVFTVYNANGGSTTAISNTAAEAKAVKFFENGQLIIMMNNVKYNAQGLIVK